jgi:hypothetical protein
VQRHHKVLTKLNAVLRMAAVPLVALAVALGGFLYAHIITAQSADLIFETIPYQEFCASINNPPGLVCDPTDGDQVEIAALPNDDNSDRLLLVRILNRMMCGTGGCATDVVRIPSNGSSAIIIDMPIHSQGPMETCNVKGRLGVKLKDPNAPCYPIYEE